MSEILGEFFLLDCEFLSLSLLPLNKFNTFLTLIFIDILYFLLLLTTGVTLF